jgi:hypothetical protein
MKRWWWQYQARRLWREYGREALEMGCVWLALIMLGGAFALFFLPGPWPGSVRLLGGSALIIGALLSFRYVGRDERRTRQYLDALRWGRPIEHEECKGEEEPHEGDQDKPDP